MKRLLYIEIGIVALTVITFAAKTVPLDTWTQVQWGATVASATINDASMGGLQDTSYYEYLIPLGTNTMDVISIPDTGITGIVEADAESLFVWMLLLAKDQLIGKGVLATDTIFDLATADSGFTTVCGIHYKHFGDTCFNEFVTNDSSGITKYTGGGNLWASKYESVKFRCRITADSTGADGTRVLFRFNSYGARGLSKTTEH